MIVKVSAINELLSTIAECDTNQAKRALKQIKRNVETQVNLNGQLKNKQAIKNSITSKIQDIIRSFKHDNLPLFTHVVLQRRNIEIANCLLPYTPQETIDVTFYRAAATNNVNMGRFLMQYTTTKVLHQTLYWVASKGGIGFIKLLLSCNQINVNWQDKNGNTPFHAAVFGNHEEAVDIFLADEKTSINIVNNAWNSPLHTASRYNYEPIVKKLLGEKALMNLKNRIGNTPLHLGAQHGHVGVVQALVEARAYVNVRNHQLNTSLHVAYYWHHQKIINLLQKVEGIALYIENIDGDTAGEAAIRNGLLQSVIHADIDLFTRMFAKLKQIIKKEVMEQKKNRTEEEIAERVAERMMKKISTWKIYDEGNRLTLMEKAVRNKNKAIIAYLLPYTDRKIIAPILYLAVGLGNLSILVLLVGDKRVKAEIIDENGNTLIHIAAYRDCEEIIQFLLNKTSIDPNFINKKGFAAIHYATRKNCKNSLRALCNAKGINVNIKTRTKQNTSLHIAVSKGHKDSMQLLIKHPDIDLVASNIDQQSPLMLATKEIIKNFLIEKIVEKYTLANQEVEILRKISEFNNSKITKSTSMPPLIKAIYDRETQRALDLIEQDDGIHINERGPIACTTPLMCSITLNNEKVTMKLLQQKNINLNARDDNDNTAIFYAVFKGEKEIVRLLLNEKKIDTSMIDKMGKSVLWVARYQQKYEENNNNEEAAQLYKDIAEMLINHYSQLVIELFEAIYDYEENKKYWAKIETILAAYPDLELNRQSPYNNGGTLLMLAVMAEDIAVVWVLLKFGADPNISNWAGDTPLIVASREGYKEIAEILLEYGANIHQQNKRGYTAFQIACDQKDKAMASLLVNQQDDKRGYTPFILAVAQNSINRVQWVVDNCPNLDVNKQTKLGNTATMISIAKEHKEMTHLLLSVEDLDLGIENKQHLTALSIAISKLDSDIVGWIISKAKKNEILIWETV